MALLKGDTIQLYTLKGDDADEFGVPTGKYTYEDVENVLIGSPTEQEVAETVKLYGKKAVYTLAIPIGDTHDWSDRLVGFYGKIWHTIGYPIQYNENALSMLPKAIPWNTKVRVELYNGEIEVDGVTPEEEETDGVYNVSILTDVLESVAVIAEEIEE